MAPKLILKLFMHSVRDKRLQASKQFLQRETKYFEAKIIISKTLIRRDRRNRVLVQLQFYFISDQNAKMKIKVGESSIKIK